LNKSWDKDNDFFFITIGRGCLKNLERSLNQTRIDGVENLYIFAPIKNQKLKNE